MPMCSQPYLISMEPLDLRCQIRWHQFILSSSMVYISLIICATRAPWHFPWIKVSFHGSRYFPPYMALYMTYTTSTVQSVLFWLLKPKSNLFNQFSVLKIELIELKRETGIDSIWSSLTKIISKTKIKFLDILDK